MALMPYSGVVENNEVEENTSFVEETQLDESEVQLRDKYDPLSVSIPTILSPNKLACVT